MSKNWNKTDKNKKCRKIRKKIMNQCSKNWKKIKNVEKSKNITGKNSKKCRKSSENE